MISQITIGQNKLIQKGEVLHIDLMINIPFFHIQKNGSVAITPILSKNEYKQELPRFLINGKERHKGYKKMVQALGKETIHSTYNIYKAFELKRDSSLVYNVRIRYEEWMNNAKIDLLRQKPNGN